MYIGYPISLETAFNIFGKENPEMNALHGGRCNVLLGDINEELKKHDLYIYFYDKNVYILGKRVYDFSASSDTHYLVIDAIEVMIGYKNKVIAGLKAAGANLAEFDIEVMEGEPTKVKNPQPYVIT